VSDAEVLLCTDTFWDAHHRRAAEIAPGIEAVVLRESEQVPESELDRVTCAFFSHDAWPDRAPAFFGAATRTPNLRWFHTMSAGVDSPVFQSFIDRGAQLTTSSGSNAAPIARTVMMYLLALTRGLPMMLRAQAEGEWTWHRWRELEGRQVAVVGYGPIGREVCRLAAEFAMDPVIVRREAKGDEPFPVRRITELAAIAAEADALVMALPLNDQTEGIVPAEVIDELADDALFVNVGRGGLVDQDALTAALADGRLGGAGLDVTTPEPLPSDHPLWKLPNVIITPHNSGSTDRTAGRATECFFTNLGHLVNRRPLINEVT